VRVLKLSSEKLVDTVSWSVQW